MIIKENITIDGREFTRTYSDTYKIRKIGTDEIYTDAMDVLDFEYEETDKIGTDEIYSEAVDVPDSGYAYEETEMEAEATDGD